MLSTSDNIGRVVYDKLSIRKHCLSEMFHEKYKYLQVSKRSVTLMSVHMVHSEHIRASS